MFRIGAFLMVSLFSVATFAEGVMPHAGDDAASESQGYSTPLFAVLHDLGEGFQENPSKLRIEQTVSNDSIESPGHASIFLEETTPMDDSVAAVRYIYALSQTDGKWKIDSKSTTQRCVKGRGHADFSPQKCH